MDCKTFDWPPQPRGKTLGRRFYSVVLAPAFLLHLAIATLGAYMPTVVVRLLTQALAMVYGCAVLLDVHLTRHVFGSGLTHD